jgi:hypothetical protein
MHPIVAARLLKSLVSNGCRCFKTSGYFLFQVFFDKLFIAIAEIQRRVTIQLNIPFP